MVRIAQAFASSEKKKDIPRKTQLIKKSASRKLPDLPKMKESNNITRHTPVNLLKSEKVELTQAGTVAAQKKKDYVTIRKSDLWKFLVVITILAMCWIILVLSSRVKKMQLDLNKLKMIISQHARP